MNSTADTRVRGWHGRQGKGAARKLREQKRLEAQIRDSLCPTERRRSYRLGRAA